MVTHDPVAAAWTDRVVFLADGRVVDELRDPSREQVITVMAAMADGAGGTGTRTGEGPEESGVPA